jgi:hypothetical protein
MQNKDRKATLYAKLILPCVYAFILAALPVDVFSQHRKDLSYVTDSWLLLLKNWQQGIFVSLVDQPVRLLYNAVLDSFFPPDNMVNLIALVIAFIALELVLTSSVTFALSIKVLLFPVLLRTFWVVASVKRYIVI